MGERSRRGVGERERDRRSTSKWPGDRDLEREAIVGVVKVWGGDVVAGVGSPAESKILTLTLIMW